MHVVEIVANGRPVPLSRSTRRRSRCLLFPLLHATKTRIKSSVVRPCSRLAYASHAGRPWSDRTSRQPYRESSKQTKAHCRFRASFGAFEWLRGVGTRTLKLFEQSLSQSEQSDTLCCTETSQLIMIDLEPAM